MITHPDDRETALAGLSDDERAQALHSESLWRQAHLIASAYAGVDPGDVYHALPASSWRLPSGFAGVCLVGDFALTPAERRLYHVPERFRRALSPAGPRGCRSQGE